MAQIADYKPGDKVHVLVYGSFKSGKTVGAGTFPRPIFLDFDKGVASLASPWFKQTIKAPWIEYETFQETKKDVRGVVSAPHAYDDACRIFDKWMKPGEVDKFDTWVIDSGTTLYDVAENKAIYLLGGVMKDIKSITHKEGLQHGLIVPKIQDFGAGRSLTEQFIRMVKDANKNVVLICHEQHVMDDNGVVREISPMFTGKSRQEIPLMFDEVYRLTVSRKGPDLVRSLMTQPDSISRVGTRLGVADGTAWTYDALLKSIHATQEKK